MPSVLWGARVASVVDECYPSCGGFVLKLPQDSTSLDSWLECTFSNSCFREREDTYFTTIIALY